MRNNAAFIWGQIDIEKEEINLPLDARGWEVEWSGGNGVVRSKSQGMGSITTPCYPLVSLAITKAFVETRSADK